MRFSSADRPQSLCRIEISPASWFKSFGCWWRANYGPQSNGSIPRSGLKDPWVLSMLFRGWPIRQALPFIGAILTTDQSFKKTFAVFEFWNLSLMLMQEFAENFRNTIWMSFQGFGRAPSVDDLSAGHGETIYSCDRCGIRLDLSWMARIKS